MRAVLNRASARQAPGHDPCPATCQLRVSANGLGNLAACSVDELAKIVRNRLKRIQYRPALIDGFLAQTGLTLGPGPP
jgi:hypothetical protein